MEDRNQWFTLHSHCYLRHGPKWKRRVRSCGHRPHSGVVPVLSVQARPYHFPVCLVMDLPTPREIELETALRKRDAQVAELTVRLTAAPERPCRLGSSVDFFPNPHRLRFHDFANFWPYNPNRPRRILLRYPLRWCLCYCRTSTRRLPTVDSLVPRPQARSVLR
jgi:hypothetical protein